MRCTQTTGLHYQRAWTSCMSWPIIRTIRGCICCELMESLIQRAPDYSGNQSTRIFVLLSFCCGLRKSFKFIGIWTRPAYCGLLINSSGQQTDFEKSRSALNSLNRSIFKVTSPLRRLGVPQGLIFHHKTKFLNFVDTHFVVFSVLGQCLAIQPADCGH
jgi:hypothetical protein